MPKYCVIYGEQKYWEIKIREIDVSITKKYYQKINSYVKINCRYIYILLMVLYVYEFSKVV